MQKIIRAFLLVAVVLFAWQMQFACAFSLNDIFKGSNNTTSAAIKRSELPAEARQVLELINTNGPFLFPRDGIIFKNREKILPLKGKKYYREYTVITPGLKHRGARRIIIGGEPIEVYYYSDDHYRSFKRIID